MFAVLSLIRKAISRLRLPRGPLLLVTALGLAACQPGAMPGPIAGDGPRVSPDSEVPVALLVPGGSGEASDDVLARSLENAARMAAADLRGARIDLRVYDTAGRADRAAEAARRAVDEGAQIILGPVFSESARAAGQAVASANVNVLSFSNNKEVAGGNVFVLGPTFDNTARRLVDYAAQSDQRRIMILHERNDSGRQGRRAIEDAVARSPATVAAVRSFEFSQQGVVDALPDITSGARESGVDAVFMTSDTAGALPLLAQLLPENRVTPDDFQFIGLTRWDIPSSTLQLSGLQGGWFALPDPARTRRFEQRYQSRYDDRPHPIAGLAFDGIAAIGALVSEGRRDALSREALTQGAGFAGATGVFRLRFDGTSERGLAVAEIRDEQVNVLDPAPRAFTGPGS